MKQLGNRLIKTWESFSLTGKTLTICGFSYAVVNVVRGAV